MIIQKSTTSKFKIVLGACCLALLTHVNTARAVGPDSQTLHYAVTFIGKKAGEMEVVIENNPGEIKATNISHLSTLASMFLTGLTEETWFSVNGDVVRLERGHTLSHKNNSVEGSFVIDREKGVLLFDPGDTVALAEKAVFESTAFPMALMLSDIESIEGQKILEVSPKRARAYVYLAPAKEILEHNGKNYETWKVIRHRQDDTARTVTIWLDRNNQQLPLKIITTKKKNDTVLSLLPQS